MHGEEDIIQRFLTPLTRRVSGAFDLIDDAAMLRPRAGYDLVLTADALVAGVHFLSDDPPFDIAVKAVTVNLSDLVAKGAEPVGYVMTLALPSLPNEAWLSAFTAGLDREMDGRLLGGDLTRTSGPLTISITAIGEVPEGQMVHRFGARAGDLLFVGGDIGASAIGLKLAQDPALATRWAMDPADVDALLTAYRAPVVRQPGARARFIRDYASAGLDVSDGLLLDTQRLCAASDVGCDVAIDALPLHPAIAKLMTAGAVDFETIATGGDDYVPLIAVAPDRAADFRAAVLAEQVFFAQIGYLMPAHAGLRLIDHNKTVLPWPDRAGFDHF